MEALNAKRRAYRDFIAREQATRATLRKHFTGPKRADPFFAELLAMTESIVTSPQVLDPASSYFGQDKFMWGLHKIGVDTIIY